MVGAEAAFDAVACAEMVAHGKPAPDVYLLAAQKLELPPDGTGSDSESDLSMLPEQRLGSYIRELLTS